jgi:hypothetical protein
MSTLMIYGLFPLFMEAEPVLLTISFAKTVWKTYWQLLYVHSNLFTDTPHYYFLLHSGFRESPIFCGFLSFYLQCLRSLQSTKIQYMVA